MELAKKVIGKELELFEIHFKEAVKSRVSLLDRIMQYIVKRKGKQMRPMFVLLSAKLNGEINDASYRAASLVELLHTATLVHDDVVDDTLERRGFFSINALWKNSKPSFFNLCGWRILCNTRPGKDPKDEGFWRICRNGLPN